MKNLNYMVVISAHFPFGRTLTRGYYKTLESAHDAISKFLNVYSKDITYVLCDILQFDRNTKSYNTIYKSKY